MQTTEELDAELDLTAEIETPRSWFDQQPVLGYVEADQACRNCGHNLRTRPICREPRTRILVCRCPQCGQFQPATDRPAVGAPSWSRYLARSLMYLWLIIVASGGIGVAICQGASTLLILELITTHANVPAQVQETPRITGIVWHYVPKRHLIEYKALTYSTVALSMAVVFVAAVVAAVVFYHWRTWALLVFFVVEPAAIAFAACLLWRANAPELLGWGSQVIALLAGAQMAAGLLGAALGRPLVRLLVCLAVPPNLRSILEHLWHADGQEAPIGVPAPSSAGRRAVSVAPLPRPDSLTPGLIGKM